MNSEDLQAGSKRNFQVFDPLNFLAEVTQHIPDPGEHLIRYYGFYSNKSRGLRTKKQGKAASPAARNPVAAPSAKEARKRWAALIKQVYEIDPLVCPKCYSQMKIIAFIGFPAVFGGIISMSGQENSLPRGAWSL